MRVVAIGTRCALARFSPSLPWRLPRLSALSPSFHWMAPINEGRTPALLSARWGRMRGRRSDPSARTGRWSAPAGGRARKPITPPVGRLAWQGPHQCGEESLGMGGTSIRTATASPANNRKPRRHDGVGAPEDGLQSLEVISCPKDFHRSVRWITSGDETGSRL